MLLRLYADGKQVGAVSVGVPMQTVYEALADGNKKIIIGSVIGLIVGAIGAYLLSIYIKRILLGLEPSHIAKILGERNTMLQSVHEGLWQLIKKVKLIWSISLQWIFLRRQVLKVIL